MPSSVGCAWKQLQGDSLKPGLCAVCKPSAGAAHFPSPRPPTLPKIVGSGGREAPRICPTPGISHLIGATVPTITTRGWPPFASASREPPRSATAEMTVRAGDINRDSCVRAAGRTLPTSLPPRPRVAHAAAPRRRPLPPPKRARPRRAKYKLAYNFLCSVFSLHPHCARARSPALHLSSSSRLPSLGRARPGSRQRGERTADCGLREPGRGRRAAGSRAAPGTESRQTPAGPPPAADPQPRSPRAARTLARSCAQLLGGSALPLQSGPPLGCTLGFEASPPPPPRPPAPGLLSEGKVDQRWGWGGGVQRPWRGACTTPGRHTPSSAPSPAPVEELVPGGSHAGFPYLPEMHGLRRSSAAADPTVTHPLGDSFRGVHLPGERRGRKGRELPPRRRRAALAANFCLGLPLPG